MPSAARTGAFRLHPCGQSHTTPRRAQVLDMFTSTKMQEKIKSIGPEKKPGGKEKDTVWVYMENNFFVWLSKLFPTVIWSAIQLMIVISFALIYMYAFKCEDFATIDSWDRADGTHESACTAEKDGSPDPNSTLCALFAPCRSSAFRRGTIPSRRPSRKFESALWYSIVTMTTVGWAAPAALRAREAASECTPCAAQLRRLLRKVGWGEVDCGYSDVARLPDVERFTRGGRRREADQEVHLRRGSLELNASY